MSWTDERVVLLKKLWGEGKTAAEIAKALGGVTRNAVIGKAHRLKLSNRISPIQRGRSSRPRASSVSLGDLAVRSSACGPRSGGEGGDTVIFEALAGLAIAVVDLFP